ncbi:MAG TPA: cysteine hydrolase family protein [Burkholderiaceae bacterium]|nr:cysteine hydrolase family protein [Burkholderiaceae bacterium]
MFQALLVIDVQHILCNGDEAAFDIARVIERINTMAAKARAAGVPVFLIQHEDQGPMRHGSEGWQLDARLSAQPDDIRVRKTATDSFHHTELQALLRARDVEHLVVCGLQSEFCVDSTVRRALALGYPVVLVSDAHSTIDNGVLTAAQISAHHTTTLSHLDSFGPRVTPVAAAEVRFDA